MKEKLQVNRQKTRIGRHTLYSEVYGSGEPLILLHGLAGSTRWWSKNIAFFAQSYQVHLLDLVGFGRARGQRFILKEAADLIAGWLSQSGLPPVHLVGHSMGGYITVELAVKHPDLVDHMVLVDALALPIGRNILRNSLALLQALRYMPFNFLPVLVTDSLRAGPLTLMKAIQEVLAADISQALQQVKAPSLIVWGEKDTVLPLQLGLELHKELPGSYLEIIKGAGHNPMWDRPEKFNQVVGNFLCARAEAAGNRECDEEQND